MCLCVCLSSNLMINTSETERFIGRAQYEAYRKVHMVRRLMTSSVTSRDSMTSHIHHNLQSRHIRKLEPGSTIRVDCRPVKHTETERFIGRAQYEAYRKVHMVRRLMTSSVTSRDSMTSHIRHNLQSRHIRKLEPGSTIRVDCRPVKHTIS